MRAVVNTPGGASPIELRDVPEPEPGPGEVLVEVKAVSLNRGELTSFKNNPEGWRPGQDVAGVVASVRDAASGVAAGSRVVALLDEAGWAERVAVPLHRLAVLPDAVAFEQAAALPVAGITALRTVRYGEPLLGRKVLVNGAAGGVGSLAVQLATTAGARVTAVARAEHSDAVRALGAVEVVDSPEAARGPFRLILESVGGAALKAAFGRVEANGTIVVFGNSSRQPTEFAFNDFFAAQNARVQTFFSFSSGPEEAFAADLALLAGLVADGALQPQIGSVRSWRDIAQAAADLAGRRLMGKAVFRID